MRKIILSAILVLIHFNIEAQVQWAHIIDSEGFDLVNKHVIDNDNNVIVTGHFEGRITIGNKQFVSQNGTNIFVYKTNYAGEIIWVKIFRSEQYGNAWPGISVDDLGNIYVSGNYPMDINLDGISLFNDEWNNVFFCKLDKDGNLQWLKGIESMDTFSEALGLWAISANSKGDFVIATIISGSIAIDNVLIENVYNSCLIATFDNSGTLKWYQLLPAVDIRDLHIDETKQVYYTGWYTGELNIGSYNLKSTSPEHSDVLVGKFDEAGNPLWAKGFNKLQAEELNNSGRSLYVDPLLDEVFVGGDFKGQLKAGTYTLTAINYDEISGNSDAFLIKMTKDGNVLYGKRFGTDQPDVILDIKKSKHDQILIAGSWHGQPFISKLNSVGDVEFHYEIKGIGFIEDISMIPKRNFLVSGAFYNTLNDGEQTWQSKGSYDGFLFNIGCFQSEDLPKIPILDHSCKEITLKNYNGHDSITWYLDGKIIGEMEKIEMPKNGIYNVTLENECGIAVSDKLTFKKDAYHKIYNVITPNGDNKNEKFVIHPTLKGSQLEIYNRWGSLLYENSDYNNTWGGAGLVPGTYYWRIHNECLGDIKGTLTIIH